MKAITLAAYPLGATGGKGSVMNRLAIAAVLAATATSPLMAYPLVQAECRGREVECALKHELDFVSIFGSIGTEDVEFFEKLDAALPNGQPFPTVFLNSPGGSGQAAMQIGRILRKRHAAAESGSPIVEDFHPQCSSACVVLAAGAETRRLTHIGLHSAHRRVKTEENVAHDEAVDLPEVYAYYEEMGIPDEVAAISKATSFKDMTDFFYDWRRPHDEQEIVRFGFFMPEVAPFDPSSELPGPYLVPMADQEYSELAYEAGALTAAYDVAQALTRYDPEVPPDFVAANEWLAKGAERGDMRATHVLAYHYQYAVGIEVDLAKAISLYRSAASAGFAASQNNLGWAYYEGKDVPKSLPDAIYWITRSAEQGEAFAYGSLCEISGATDLFKTDPTEAYMWCGLAVEYLPDGDAKDAAQTAYDQIMATISHEDLAAGSLQVRQWNEEHVTSSMRNVGDDLN